MDFSDDLANIIGSNERSTANNPPNPTANSANANTSTEYRTHNIFDMGAPAHAATAYHPYRQTPSPTTGTSQPHRSLSRSSSRPPSSGASSALNNFGVPVGSSSNSSANTGDAAQGGAGSVGPTRTTRSRRNNSVSSVSPPPYHSKPQAILIPGSAGHSGNGSWFGGNGGAGEFTLPTPDSLTSPLSAHSPIHTSHSHSNHHPGNGNAGSYGSSPHHTLHGLHQHGSFSDIDFGVGLSMNGMPSSNNNSGGAGPGRNIPISGGYPPHHGHGHGGGHPSSFGPSSFGSMSSSLGLGSPSEHGLHHHQQHQHQQPGSHSSQHQGHHGGMMGDETPLSASLPTLPTSLHDMHSGHGHGHQQQQQHGPGHSHATRSTRSHSVSVAGAKADAGGNATPTPGGMGFNLSTLNVNVSGHGLGLGMSSPNSIPSHISSIPGPNHGGNLNRSMSNMRGAELNNLNMPMANLSTSDKQTLLANEKRRRRRESHNAVERRRRDNINEKISELATLIPECMLEGAATNNTKESSNSPNPSNVSVPNASSNGVPPINTILPNSSGGGGLSLDSPTSPTSALSLMSPIDGESGVGVWNLDMGVEMLVPKKEDVDEGTEAGAAGGSGAAGAGNGVVKANKGMILRKSVEYIRYLQQLVTAQGARNRELEQELKAYRTGGVPPNVGVSGNSPSASATGPASGSSGDRSSPAHSHGSNHSPSQTSGQGGNTSGLTLDGIMMNDMGGGDMNEMNVGEGMGMGMSGEMMDVSVPMGNMGMNNMGMFDMMNGVNGMMGMPMGMDMGGIPGHGISNVRGMGGMFSNQYGGRTLHPMREEGEGEVEGENHEGKQEGMDIDMDSGNAKGRGKEESGMLSPVSPPRDGLPTREKRSKTGGSPLSEPHEVEEDQEDHDEDSDSEGSDRKRKRRNGRGGPGKRGADEDEDYVDEENHDGGGEEDDESAEISNVTKTRAGTRGKGKTLTKIGTGEEKESRGRRGRDAKSRRGNDEINGVATRTRRTVKAKVEDDVKLGVVKGISDVQDDEESGSDDVEEQVGRLRTRRAARRVAGVLDDEDDGMEY
ncbi:hypothetical protein D9758_006927 [Tetrapyrgos nigripes]|uniref:BHLH domain-containing protein n=1 Tax=Tetrapyrgos nigripes TaxID=182062 RepID=A0A8H5LUW3_9AGAR|nr:hypothetical protein D9758_006927 [Tetrapyrgos nigripes]